MKMRGQAHVVFRDSQSAAAALRNLSDMEFFGKKMVCLDPLVAAPLPSMR
jgi:RNA recognition motif-containing protein